MPVTFVADLGPEFGEERKCNVGIVMLLGDTDVCPVKRLL